MEEILKENKSKSHKEFEKLLSEDLNNRKLREGEIITGTVSNIGKKHVFVDISAKSIQEAEKKAAKIILDLIDE